MTSVVRQRISSSSTKSRKVVGMTLPANYKPRNRGVGYWNSRCYRLMSRMSHNKSSRTEEPSYANTSNSMSLPNLSPEMMSYYQTEMYDDISGGYGGEYSYDMGDLEDDSEEDRKLSRYLKKKKDKSDMRSRMRTLFAFLMLPSVVVIFNSHKKMNSSNSNVDMSGLAGGGLGALGGMGGGAAGVGGMGGGGMGGGGMRGGGRSPLADIPGMEKFAGLGAEGGEGGDIADQVKDALGGQAEGGRQTIDQIRERYMRRHKGASSGDEYKGEDYAKRMMADYGIPEGDGEPMDDGEPVDGEEGGDLGESEISEGSEMGRIEEKEEFKSDEKKDGNVQQSEASNVQSDGLGEAKEEVKKESNQVKGESVTTNPPGELDKKSEENKPQEHPSIDINHDHFLKDFDSPETAMYDDEKIDAYQNELHDEF